jgi:hypothetical protein
VVRVSSTSQPSNRQKIRYSRQGDTVHHHPPIRSAASSLLVNAARK